MAQSVDEILDRRLAGPAQEKYAEQKVRQSKMQKEEMPAEAEQPRTLRERVMAARRAMDLKEKAKKKLEEKVMAPAKMGTNYALRWAWTVLIPSWGLSLIYINMHVFLRWVFPSAFCKLGEEWVPKQVAGGHSSKNIAGTAFGIVEVMGLLFLDLLVGFIIFGALALIVMIVTWAEAGLVEKVEWVLGAIFDLSWSGIKDLVKLFSGLLK